MQPAPNTTTEAARFQNPSKAPLASHCTTKLAGVMMQSCEYRRWHPDKFAQRFGSDFATSEKEEIMRCVKESFQVVQQICGA